MCEYHQAVELFVITAIISINLFAVTTVLTKFQIKEIGGPFRFLAIQTSFGLVPILAVVLLTGDTLVNTDLLIWGNIWKFLMSIGFAYLGFITLMVGFSKGNASVGGVFLSSRLVVNIPLALLFLGEIYPVTVYALIVITLLGALLTSWEQGMNLRQILTLRAPGVMWYLMTMIFWALSNFYVTDLGDVLSPAQFLAYRQTVFVSISWLLYPVLHNIFDEEGRPVRMGFLKLVIPYVLLTVTAQLLFLYSLQQSLTITEGIGAAEGVVTFTMTMVTARFVGNKILNEPLQSKTLKVRFAGVVLSTAGILALTLTT